MLSAANRSKQLQTRHHRKLPQRVPDPAMWFLLGYLLVFLYFFRVTPMIVAAITLGWYLAMIIDMPARALARIKWMPFRLSVAFTSLLIFALFLYGFYQIIPIFIDEARKILPLLMSTAQELDLQEFFGTFPIEPRIIEWLESFTRDIAASFTQWGIDALNLIIQGLPGAMTGATLFILTAAYFTFVLPKLKAHLWIFFPASTRNRSLGFIRNYYINLRNFISGQVIISIIVGTLAGLGMLLFQIPNALFIGLSLAVLGLIPFIGTFIAAVPALFIGISHQGLAGGLKVLAVFLIVNQVEGWILSPRIQGKRMKLNWFLIIVAVFFTGTFLGLAGILLAVPLLAFGKKYWKEYVIEVLERL